MLQFNEGDRVIWKGVPAEKAIGTVRFANKSNGLYAVVFDCDGSTIVIARGGLERA